MNSINQYLEKIYAFSPISFHQEIRESILDIILELNIPEDVDYKILVAQIGDPKDYTDDYIHSRKGQDARDDHTPTYFNNLEKNYQDFRWSGYKINDFGLPSWIFFLILGLPSVFYLSILPKIFGYASVTTGYLDLFERFDDSSILVYTIAFLPFGLEVVSGLTGWHPSVRRDMYRLRNYYRLIFVLLQTCWMTLYSLGIFVNSDFLPTVGFTLPVYIAYEFTIWIREFALRPLSRKGRKIPLLYKIYVSYIVLMVLYQGVLGAIYPW